MLDLPTQPKLDVAFKLRYDQATLKWTYERQLGLNIPVYVQEYKSIYTDPLKRFPSQTFAIKAVFKGKSMVTFMIYL